MYILYHIFNINVNNFLSSATRIYLKPGGREWRRAPPLYGIFSSVQPHSTHTQNILKPGAKVYKKLELVLRIYFIFFTNPREKATVDNTKNSCKNWTRKMAKSSWTEAKICIKLALICTTSEHDLHDLNSYPSGPKNFQI